MKFIFADSLDFVDPRYDFAADRSPPDREPYWNDEFPHEYMGYAPYDGVLVSRAIVGDHRFPGKYTEAQSMRFRRVGAREFLRLYADRFSDKLIFGDSGAFSYHKLDIPPYTADDMVEFYEDGRFTHGCSVDHIIFDFDESAKGEEGGTEKARARRQLTLDYAAEFLRVSRSLGKHFTPIGVIQGWSPDSMASSAKSLVGMGYPYLAVGGMVPLKAPQIHACLQAIREQIPFSVPLHLLGFAKAEQIHEFTGYGVASFDSTSPLIRAFKDAKSNYYVHKADGALDYYSAIRIPQATENPTLMRLAKAGVYSQRELLVWEKAALMALRAYDKGTETLDNTLDAVMRYSEPLLLDLKGKPMSDESSAVDADLSILPEGRRTIGLSKKKLDDLRTRYKRTLSDSPWKNCTCAVCQRVGVEVIIFRASNRNKRRGMHNLSVFYQHVQTIRETSDREKEVVLQSA